MTRNKKEKKVKKERKELIWLAIFLTIIGTTEILTGVKALHTPGLTLWGALGSSAAANCNVVGELMTLWGFKTVIEKEF